MFGKKINVMLIGLLESLASLTYCLLFYGFTQLANYLNIAPPDNFGMIFGLFLLIFSAAACGLIVFGFPVKLALEKKIKEALLILAYFFAFSFLLLIILFTLMYIFTGITTDANMIM